MTEQEWLACDTTDRMYNQACIKGVSDRKLRLIVCAYCRSVWDKLPDEMSRDAVEMGERLADGLVKEGSTKEASWVLYKAIEKKKGDPDAGVYEAWASVAWLTIVPFAASALATLGSASHGRGDRAVQAKIVSVYRHVIGNPFRPAPTPDSWPATVVRLAEALYDGEDCGFALHDALLEAGHLDLADHFRQEQAHPKGCWALDLILGKK